MPNALPHRKDQADAAAKLGKRAAAQGLRALSTGTLAAAFAAVKTALKDSGAGPIGEAAGDVRALRSDGGLASKLNTDLADSQGVLTEGMLAALEAGYVSELKFQASVIKGLRFKVTPQDRRDMADYPIQGHTCAEIAVYMHGSLRYELTGLLGSPLTGDSSIKALGALVGSSMQRFADRCSNAVQEAFFAGTQMALRGIAAAMGGA